MEAIDAIKKIRAGYISQDIGYKEVLALCDAVLGEDGKPSRVFEALGTTYTRCCATCKHWDQFVQPEASHLGLCLNTPKEGKALTLKGNGPGSVSMFRPTVTDLAICSKWQEKEDAE
jgi:hypothetical protein